MPHLQVVTTDACLAEWITEHFGGNVYHRPPPKRFPQYKYKFEWFAYQKSIDSILPAVLPFLIIKRELAELMIEFRSTFSDKNQGKPLPADITEIRQSAYLKIKSINQHRNPR